MPQEHQRRQQPYDMPQGVRNSNKNPNDGKNNNGDSQGLSGSPFAG